jgi:hypothetical protein
MGVAWQQERLGQHSMPEQVDECQGNQECLYEAASLAATRRSMQEGRQQERVRSTA